MEAEDDKLLLANKSSFSVQGSLSEESLEKVKERFESGSLSESLQLVLWAIKFAVTNLQELA